MPVLPTLFLLGAAATLLVLAVGWRLRRAARREAEQARLAAEARAARTQVDAANEQLRTQAVELEQQVEEAQTLAEELEQANGDLADALRAAQESEAQIRRMFTENPLPMWVYDPATLAFLDVNDAAVATYGYSRDEFLSMTIRDIRPHEDVPRMLEVLRGAAIAGRVVRGTHRHRWRDGAIREVELTAQDWRVGGRHARLVVVFDVTDRDRVAEREHFLAEASRTLGATLDYRAALGQVVALTVPHLAEWCAVDLFDRTGALREVASAGAPARALPLTPDAGPAAVARAARTLYRATVGPHDADELLGAAARQDGRRDALLGRSVVVAPIVARERCLGALTLLSYPVPRGFAEADCAVVEEVARRAGLAIDNAERYAAEQAAREAAELAAEQTMRLQAVTAELSATLTPAAVARVVVNHCLAALGAQAGSVATADEDTAELVLLDAVGYPAEQLVPLERVPLGADLPLAECVRTGAAIMLATPEECDARYPRLAALRASTNAAAMAAVPLTVDGRRVGALGVSFPADVRFGPTERAFLLALGQQCAQAIERARLYEAEEAARAIAEAANRAKSDFLATMSHELRTPLNAIAGYAQLLEEGLYGKLSEPQRNVVGRIDRAQRHLLGLINDVLNYAKLEAGRVHYDVRETPLAEVLADAVSMGEGQLASKQVALEVVSCPADTDGSSLAVWADRDKARQVLLNLLSNAAKFTPSGGRVRVECVVPPPGADDDGDALVRIVDTGIGIAADKLEAIFEPFVQVDASRTRTQQGTGLGLAISRDLARGMGGDLRVVSEPGRGSTFTLALRRVVAANGERTDRRVHDDRRQADRRRHSDRRH